MTEQALYFAFGSLITLLAGVLAMPIVSRRAWRLARTRAILLGRSTETGAAASIDSLLAVHAVELARLQHRLAIAEDDARSLRTMVGRQSVQEIMLKAHTSDLERSMFDLRLALDRMEAERASLKVASAALQVALHDAFAQRDKARSHEAASQDRVNELMAEASRDRAKIAILSARTEEKERQLRSAKANHETAETPNVEPSNSLSGEKSWSRNLEPSRRADGERRPLMKALERAHSRSSETESRLGFSRPNREEALIETVRPPAASSSRNDAVKTPPAEPAQSESRPLVVPDQARARHVSSLSQAPGAGAEIGKEGPDRVVLPTMDAVLGESEGLRARISALSSQRDTGDPTALRTSIVRFGREVSRLFLGKSRVS